MKYVLVLMLCGIFVLASCGGEKAENRNTNEKAVELAKKVLIVDTHIDLPFRLKREWTDVSVESSKGHFDFVRARQGGLDAAFMSIYIPARYEKKGGGKALADTLIDLVEKIEKNWPDKFKRVTSPEEIESNFSSGKVMLALGIENGTALDGDLQNLRHFYERGVRYITLTHSKCNRIGDSSYDRERRWHGLSDFGKKLVLEMNKLGIMVDISHVSDETFNDVLKISKAPVIASHSGCRSFTPGFERNMSDSMIIRLAEKGGVVQINFGSYFVSKSYNHFSDSVWSHMGKYLKEHHLSWWDSLAQAHMAEYKKQIGLSNGSIADLVDHIEHVIQLVGEDHVGLGSDFDGVIDLPAGIEDVSSYPKII